MTAQHKDRTGQRIGSLVVLGLHGRTKRRRRGGRRLIWRTLDEATGRERYLYTSEIIRLDRAHEAALESGAE